MRLSHALCGALLTLGAGCGLADYESRMDEQRERLRAYDEQSKYLGAALELPGAADNESPPPIPFAVSLHLPKGISGSVAPKDGLFLARTQLIARYAGTDGYNVFVCGAFAASADESKDDKRTTWTPAEFQDSFRLALGEIQGRFFRAPQTIEPVVRPAGWKPGRRTDEKARPLAFDYFALEDKPGDADTVHMEVYVHQEGSRLLGLAFQIPPARVEDRSVQQGVDACLRSLEMGGSAKIASGKKRSFGAGSQRADPIAPAPPP